MHFRQLRSSTLKPFFEQAAGTSSKGLLGSEPLKLLGCYVLTEVL